MTADYDIEGGHFAERRQLFVNFGAPAESGRRAVAESDDPGRVARDDYTYAHLWIVAGIIATAAGHELPTAHPLDHEHGIAWR